MKFDIKAHAAWMVESGQFRGTVEEYLGFLGYEPDPPQTPTDDAPDAREVIAKAFKDTYVGHPWTDDGANRRADELIDALHAAGFRIVPAADPETVPMSLLDTVRSTALRIAANSREGREMVEVVFALIERDRAALQQRERENT